MIRFPALFLSLPFLAVSLVAQAQDVSAALPDLTYLPGEGRFVSDTTLSYGRDGESIYQPEFVYVSNGSITPTGPLYFAEKYRLNSYSATESLRYGLIDGVVIGLAETCVEAEEHYKVPGFFNGDYFTFHQNGGGCDNPRISATWRAIRQSDFADFPVNLDLDARYSPNLIPGNLSRAYAAAGGQTGDVTLTASRAFDEISLAARIGAIWAGKTKLKGSDDTVQWTDAFARPYAELLAQYKPLEEIFLTAGIKAYAAYDSDSRYVSYPLGFINGVEDLSQRQKNGASYQPELTAAWLAVPDLLSLSLSYSHAFSGTGKIYDLGDGTLANEYQNISADSVALNIRFQL